MESRAEMSCVLKVNINCETCRRKVMDVLQNLHGVYSVVVDAEKGTLKVSGNVNPYIIFKVFQKYGKHGEISCIKFQGEVRTPIYHYNYHHHNYYGGNNRFNPYEPVNPYAPIGGPDPSFPWSDGHHYPPTAFPPLPPPPPPLAPPPPPPLQDVINYFPPKAPPPVLQFEPPGDRCNIM